MTAPTLLAELERITGLLADPQGDNTAGRLDTLKYDVLPNLLRSEVGTIIRALRVYCNPVAEVPALDSQLTFFSLNPST